MNNTELNLNKFINDYMQNKEEIKIIDNKKNITFTIEKDSNEISIKYETKFKTNDKIENLFTDLIEYSTSIIDTNKYWPNVSQEYPDLMILWEIFTKINKETSQKNGATSYPQNWDNIILKIQKEIIDILTNKKSN